MPSVSRSQQALFAIAEHDPSKLHDEDKGLANLPKQTLHDFAVGPEAGKPEHVLRGDRSDVMGANRKVFKARGMNEADATKSSILASKKGRPNNLGTFLHPKRGSK